MFALTCCFSKDGKENCLQKPNHDFTGGNKTDKMAQLSRSISSVHCTILTMNTIPTRRQRYVLELIVKSCGDHSQDLLLIIIPIQVSSNVSFAPRRHRRHLALFLGTAAHRIIPNSFRAPSPWRQHYQYITRQEGENKGLDRTHQGRVGKGWGGEQIKNTHSSWSVRLDFQL